MKKEEIEDEVVPFQEGDMVPYGNIDPQLPATFEPKSGDLVFCSMPSGSREDALAVYNMLSGNSGSLADLADTGTGELAAVHVIAHRITLTNEETGEITDATRIILVDEKGEPWGCVSNGIAGSLKKLFSLVGPPPWTPPIRLRPVRVPTSKDRSRKTLILKAL